MFNPLYLRAVCQVAVAFSWSCTTTDRATSS